MFTNIIVVNDISEEYQMCANRSIDFTMPIMVTFYHFIYQTETYQFARRRFTRLVMRMDLHLRSQTSWRFWNHYTMDLL
jgi:hypothetical protein